VIVSGTNAIDSRTDVMGVGSVLLDSCFVASSQCFYHTAYVFVYVFVCVLYVHVYVYVHVR